MAKMGMPKVNINFKERGITAIERSQHGVVYLIIEDDTAKFPAVTTMYTIDDIPKELSADNKEQLELAFKGYTTTPRAVKFKVITPVAKDGVQDYTDALKQSEAVKFDYLVIPGITAANTDKVATWIKGMRDNKHKKVKAVLPNCPADTEGVVNFVNTTIKTATKTYTTAQYCSRVAGIICGTPAAISCTYAPAPELIEVEQYTEEEQDAKVDKGEFFFFSDGEKIKVARGINSFVTTIDGKGREFKKIKLVDLMDMIYTDIRQTAQDSYIGKYANSYDNRVLLINAISGYFAQLELEKLLEKNQNTVGVDIPATKAWIESNGLKSKAQLANMKEQEIKEYNVQDNVFLAASVSLLDAMECINLAIEV